MNGYVDAWMRSQGEGCRGSWRKRVKRSVKGAGAKEKSGGFRRRDGPCALEWSATSLWIFEDREERRRRVKKRRRRFREREREREGERERGRGRGRERECERGPRWAESAIEPRAGKIGVRCTLATIVALNRPRRFHLRARRLFPIRLAVAVVAVVAVLLLLLLLLLSFTRDPSIRTDRLVYLLFARPIHSVLPVRRLPRHRLSEEGGGANHGGRMGGGEWNGWLQRCRESRRLVLVIVAIALLLDNMLLTTVVPIIPEFLYDMKHPNATLSEHLDGVGSRRTTLAVTAGNPVASTASSLTTTPKCPCAPENRDANASQLEFLYTSTLSSIESTGLPENAAGSVASSAAEVDEKEQRHRELLQETVAVGIMFASKAFVQLLANPIVGPLTHKIGYSIPMFTGFIIMFLSTLIFAFGRSYGILFLARALQGVGSSCSSVSGMGMLAERYQDDKERGNAMGIALGGLALGVLIGPPFGGVMYEFVGKSAPFLILSALALGDGILQLLVLQPSVVYTEAEPPSLKTLITDPYILLAAGAITFANMGIAMLEPSLPIWMMDTMGASRWKQGATFIPASISYLIGTNLFGPLGHRMGRWLAALIGLVVIGICLMCIPLAKSIDHLIVPNAGLGFAIGMVDSSMMPELGYLVDIRHTAVYGSVYAIGDVAFCLGFAVGPALSGTLVNTIGFEWMLFGIAILNFIYAPLMYFLRAPPTKEEKKSLIIGEKSSVRYVTYQNEEEEQ